MKICYISNFYPPFVVGGAEVYVRNISEEFIKRGAEVVVISTSPNRAYYFDSIRGVKVYRVNLLTLYPPYKYAQQPSIIRPVWHATNIWNLHSYKVIKNIIKREAPDIVHIHTFKGFSLSVFNAVKSLNLPMIFTVHDYSLLCPKNNLLRSTKKVCIDPSLPCVIYRKVQKYVVDIGSPDLVTAPSQFIINKHREHGFFEDIEAIKLPLGIQLDDIRRIEKSYDVIDILYVGNLSKHKGIHILINAFKKIKQNNMRLHIIGKGKDAKKFKELAKGDSRIKFYGFVSEEQLKRMYEMANIVVVPSIWYENSPVVIYESFKHQTPVVGSRIGGIPELVEDGYNGILFEAGNSNELRSKLEYLVEDTSALKRLEKGVVESIKKYDMGDHMTKLRKIYEVIS